MRLLGELEGSVGVAAQRDHLPLGSEALEFLIAVPAHDQDAVPRRFEEIFPIFPNGPGKFSLIPDNPVVGARCNYVNHEG